MRLDFGYDRRRFGFSRTTNKPGYQRRIDQQQGIGIFGRPAVEQCRQGHFRVEAGIGTQDHPLNNRMHGLASACNQGYFTHVN